MGGTVRTSYTVRASAEGIDNPSCERERNRLDELSLVFDEDPPVMRGKRGHDVLPFQFPADEVFCAVELDTAVTVDLADERNAALGNRKNQVTAGIDVRIEREAVREMAEGRPGPIAKNAGEPGSVIGQGEASTGLLDVVVAKEAPARPAQSPQIGTRVKKDAFLPEAVKAFHGGVPAGLSRRDEEKMDAQKEMEPGELGEAVAIPPSSRRRHLVVHLSDSGKSHKSPGINEMAAERDRLLIGELAGRDRLADDIDGVEGIEPSDSPGSSQIAGTDQVGLLEITHLSGSNVWIGRSAGSTLDLDLFRLAGPGQDLFNGRDDREMTNTPVMELMMDRLGADAGEGGAAGLGGRQLVAQGQDLTHQRLRRLMREMFRHPA